MLTIKHILQCETIKPAPHRISKVLPLNTKSICFVCPNLLSVDHIWVKHTTGVKEEPLINNNYRSLAIMTGLFSCLLACFELEQSLCLAPRLTKTHPARKQWNNWRLPDKVSLKNAVSDEMMEGKWNWFQNNFLQASAPLTYFMTDREAFSSRSPQHSGHVT